MPIIKTLDILRACEAGKYAVGAFDINGLDQPQAIIKKAEELKSPILMVIPGVIEKYVNFEDYVAVTARAAKNAKIPVGIHLSHGGDLAQFERAAKAGFTSIMFDGSAMSYEDNIRMTAEAVKIGHRYGAAVEGELGAIGSSFATVEESMTDPELAKEYVEKTGVDILAVSIGNAHGFYKGTPKLDFNRLAELKAALAGKEVYLTLHGGTGIPEDHIKKAIQMGIVKICIYTEMCAQGKDMAKKYLAEHPDYAGNYDVPELYKAVLDGFTHAEEECIRMFMSDGKASGEESDGVLELNMSLDAPGGAVINHDVGPAYPSLPTETHRPLVDTGYWDKNM